MSVIITPRDGGVGLKFWALSAALAVHGSLVVAIGHGSAPQGLSHVGPSALEVEVLGITAEQRPEPPAPEPEPAQVAATGRAKVAAPAPSPTSSPPAGSLGGSGGGEQTGAVAVEVAAPRFSLSIGTTGVDRVGAVNGAAASTVPETLTQQQVTSAARLVSSVKPAYPDEARADGREAEVTLELTVGTSGEVLTARVEKSGGRDFDDAAMAAVREYRFTAAEREGRRVRVRLPWTVEFRLH